MGRKVGEKMRVLDEVIAEAVLLIRVQAEKEKRQYESEKADYGYFEKPLDGIVRQLCHDMLEAAEVDSLWCCPLCQS
jgi:hypothetical protein